MKIYVGNLAPSVSDEELRKEFEAFGNVETVDIIKDKFSGQSRGFGFVEMRDKSEALSALNALNGKELKNQTLTVNEARPRNDAPRGQQGRRGGGRRY